MHDDQMTKTKIAWAQHWIEKPSIQKSNLRRGQIDSDRETRDYKKHVKMSVTVRTNNTQRDAFKSLASQTIQLKVVF